MLNLEGRINEIKAIDCLCLTTDQEPLKILRAELEAKEYRRVPVVNGAAWDSWVPKFFARHCETKKTFDRYEGAWKIDQREKVEDLVQWRDAVQFPTGGSFEMSSRFHTAASIEK